MRKAVVSASLLLGALGAGGCHRSSHATVHSYEYSDQGRSMEHMEPMPRDRESDSHMVAPGQMVSPGEMVPPGRPVVEPERRP